MGVPVGLNIWSGLVGDTMPYLDQVVEPFDSIWYPDHVQYGAKNVAEGWSLLAFGLARYPDKLQGHQVLCNSFRNPAHLAAAALEEWALLGTAKRAGPPARFRARSGAVRREIVIGGNDDGFGQRTSRVPTAGWID